MPIDPDVQPLLDVKADKAALAVLELRMAALEARAHVHTEPVPPPPPPPLPPPPPPPPPSAPGGIAVTPATLSVIATAPAGATLQFAAGLYKRLWIQPKDGQTYLGGAGVVLDGEGVTEYAFRGNTSVAAKNVTVRGFEVKNYLPMSQPGWSLGAVTSKWFNGQVGGDGWLVENCDVHHNRGSGVMLTDRGTVRKCHVHHNLSMGVKLYWAPTGGLVEDNEIDNNNYDGPDDFNETGGTKFAWTTGMVVRRNFSHHNHGPGLWTDIDNVNALYEDNRCEDNQGPGIFHEISYKAVIRRNQLRRNGLPTRGWMWEAGIMIAGSKDVEIYDNILEDNNNAISLIQQNRGSGAIGQYLLKNVEVRNNTVRGGRNGAVKDWEPTGGNIFASGNLRWIGNKYSKVAGFAWTGSTGRSWPEWQGFGLDVAGSHTP